MEHYFQQSVEPDVPDMADDVEKCKSTSIGAARQDNNSSGSFECNICLDSVQDPVVTFCGHLFCWPCIYKWIQVRTISHEDLNHQPQCPVCKAEVSESTIIPLYGRGQSMKASDGKAKGFGLVIPRRPMAPACGVHTLVAAATTRATSHATQPHHHSYPSQAQPYYNQMGDYTATSPPVSLAATDMLNLGTSMFGQMIYARIFGNSHSTLYTYPDSYHLSAVTSPRLRRHVMQVDRSMSRISCFLFCCVMLCLLLF
ncbi:hypothetical protein Ancab_011050 [Ancistrocladus abbreviatus]